MDQFHRFALGEFDCVVLYDHSRTASAQEIFPAVPGSQQLAAMEDGASEFTELTVGYNCLYVDTGRQLKPFNLQLGGIYTFGQRVVYLGVHFSDEMAHIRHILKSVIGRDKHRRFRPHLTLAMRLDEPAHQAMLAELADSAWQKERFNTPLEELQLMQRGPHDPAWRCISTLPLGG